MHPAVRKDELQRHFVQISGLIPLGRQVADQALKDAGGHRAHDGHAHVSPSCLIEHVQCCSLVNEVVAYLDDVEPTAVDQRARSPGLLHGKADETHPTAHPKQFQGVEQTIVQDVVYVVLRIHPAMELDDVDDVGPKACPRNLCALHHLLC